MYRTLEELNEAMSACRACALHETRTRVVCGAGRADAPIMLIGEAPGKHEDLQGSPFVGASGARLEGYLEEAGLTRDDIFIANVLKCRPPKNRNPKPEEIACCMPYLETQIDLIHPQVIVCLGAFATQSMLQVKGALSEIRGQVFQRDNSAVIPTYHPAACIYRPLWREAIIQDLRTARSLIGR